MGSIHASTVSLPIIDLSSPTQETASQLVDAARDHGFFFIKSSGLGISKEQVSGMFDLAQTFFKSSAEDKRICLMGNDNRGYSYLGAEILDPSAAQRTGDFKERLNFGEFENDRAQQKLNPLLQAHEAQLAQFTSTCQSICDVLYKTLAVGLSIPDSSGEPGKTYISSRHDASKGPSATTLSLIYYPAHTPSDSTDIRAGAHSDYGSLTLLFRKAGQEGLEILDDEGTWKAVPVSPHGSDEAFPPILVNIGDVLEFWTGGLLKSSVHRVTFPPIPSNKSEADIEVHDRYSIAFFAHPLASTVLSPIPSPLVEQAKERGLMARFGDKYRGKELPAAITAGEHVTARLNATYSEEFQVKK